MRFRCDFVLLKGRQPQKYDLIVLIEKESTTKKRPPKNALPGNTLCRRIRSPPGKSRWIQPQYQIVSPPRPELVWVKSRPWAGVDPHPSRCVVWCHTHVPSRAHTARNVPEIKSWKSAAAAPLPQQLRGETRHEMFQKLNHVCAHRRISRRPSRRRSAPEGRR